MGHSPFGHIGEKFLNQFMQEFGGFEHNRQALRVVDLLEHPYPDFTGLNLAFETRLGLARHKGPYDKPEKMGFDEINCTLEGQIANMADRIAYNCHDLEDGLRAQLITVEQLKSIELFNIAQENIKAKRIQDKSVKITRTAKATIDILVSDCIRTSNKAIGRAQPETFQDICFSEKDFVFLSPEYEKLLKNSEQFLLRGFYMHEIFKKTEGQISKHLEQLLEKLSKQPELMPSYYQNLVDIEGPERVAADYIAGMTDRFCLEFFETI
jgi:dGTPase